MRSLALCTGCQQYHYRDELACPHCNAAGPARVVGQMARKIRMGGLMVFTALTTTACYGAPAQPPKSMPSKSPPAVETPAQKVPTKVGTAFLYSTPKDGKAQSATLTLGKARIDGAKLTIDSGENGFLSLSIEADSADAFNVVEAGTARAPLTVETLKAFALETKSGTPVKAAVPADAKGTLQIDNVTEKAISGVLLVEIGGTTVQLYFNAAR